ncbi:MAG: lytic transglycosylase F [Thermodesulfobacteriota bacterium]
MSGFRCLLCLALLALLAAPAPAAEVMGQKVPMSGGVDLPVKEDLPGILERTRLVVGTVYAIPYFFFGPDGHEQGFDCRLLNEYGRRLNRSRGRRRLPVAVVFLPMPYERLIPALNQGYVDVVAAGLTITPSRARQAAFTKPYLSGVDEVVVANRAVTGLQSLDDLAGRQVFVRQGSSYFRSLLKLNQRLRSERKPPVEIIPADETLSTSDILEMVNAGIAQLTVADAPVAGLWAGVLSQVRVYPALVLRRGGELAMLVRKSSPQLLASLNAFIQDHRKGTRLGNVLFKQYFQSTRWIKNPEQGVLRQRLRRYMHWFEEYARQHNLDPLLVAAQALRESGLDQSKVSPAGAVGLMQVLPSLAQDQRLHVQALHQPQHNISAGVQYLSLLRDRYFSEPGIHPDDRLRFALAAYNAGPARIARVRRQAAQMGFDPKQWFANCEVAALKHIGREPVEYVRDINKYYVALKMARRQHQQQQELKQKKLALGR